MYFFELVMSSAERKDGRVIEVAQQSDVSAVIRFTA